VEEHEVQAFIDATKAYFAQMTDEPAEVGTPYLLDEDSTVLDFTGVIGISGTRRGCVYFSTPRALLEHILTHLGEVDLSEDTLIDLAGEIANTLAGNVRKDFGKDFLISIPVVIQGQPRRLRALSDSRGFVIPIKWKGIRSCLVISLDSKV